MTCPRCGLENPQGKVVCARCGTRLRPAAAAASSGPATANPERFMKWLRGDLVRLAFVTAAVVAAAAVVGMRVR